MSLAPVCAEFSDFRPLHVACLVARRRKPLCNVKTEYNFIDATSRSRFSRLAGCRRLGGYPPRDYAHQRIVNTRVELLSHVDPEMVECREGREWLAVGTLGRKCVESVCRAKDPGAERNRFARQSEGIPDPVPALMMVLDVFERLLDVEEGRQDLESNPHVLFHVLEFVGGQSSGFVENRLANPDLAHIVEATGDSEVLDHVFLEAELLGKQSGELGHS